MSDCSESLPEACPTPTSLLSLPAELTTRIALELDLSSSLALARTAKALVGPAESRIWRELDVAVHSAPYVRLDLNQSSNPLTHSVDNEAPTRSRDFAKWGDLADVYEAACSAHQVAIQAKVAAILVAMDERRASLVRRIRLVPSRAAEGMVSILRVASAKLESLTIEAPAADDPLRYTHLPAEEGHLDRSLIRTTLHFPSLTHLVLGPESFRFAELIPALVNASPNLTHLSADVTIKKSYPTHVPPVSRTKLQYIRFRFGDVNMLFDSVSHLIDVIGQSPDLRSLWLCYVPFSSLDSREVYKLLFAAMGKCEQLEELDWAGVPWAFPEHLNAEVKPGQVALFGGLKRMLWRLETLETLENVIPILPDLHTVYVLVPGDLPKPPDESTPVPPIQSMSPELARRLRCSPNLRTLRSYPRQIPEDHFGFFDLLDDQPTVELGQIRSIHHAGRELLFARFLLPSRDHHDGAIGGPSLTSPAGMLETRYPPAALPSLSGVDGGLPQPKWQVISDLDGRVVPLEVIRSVLEVEGVKWEEWRRGLEVSEEAWEVVERWEAQKEEVEVDRGGIMCTLGKQDLYPAPLPDEDEEP